MDLHTKKVLKLIKSHSRIKNFLLILSYLLIIGGIFSYVFYAFNQSHTIKLVNEFKQNERQFKSEKIMTNPRIKFQYNDDQTYQIRAKQAFHRDEQEVILYDVFATGEIGNISAGELKINEEGNHLVFSQNPILILNESNKNNGL